MKRICLLFALMLSGCASNTYYFPVVKKPAAAPVLEKKRIESTSLIRWLMSAPLMRTLFRPTPRSKTKRNTENLFTTS